VKTMTPTRPHQNVRCGLLAAVECRDKHKNCGGNPGWPKAWCDSQHQFVLDNCQALCGLCREYSDIGACHRDVVLRYMLFTGFVSGSKVRPITQSQLTDIVHDIILVNFLTRDSGTRSNR